MSLEPGALRREPWAMSYIDFAWKELWSIYDEDGDGVISEAEFVRMYKERLSPLIQAAQAEVEGYTPPPVTTSKRRRDVISESEHRMNGSGIYKFS